jgi:hypothetical protein
VLFLLEEIQKRLADFGGGHDLTRDGSANREVFTLAAGYDRR